MSTQTTVRTVALAATITASIALGAFWNAGLTPDHTQGLPACATEDSRDCYWDAAVQGNGQGVSFTDIGGTQYLWGAR